MVYRLIIHCSWLISSLNFFPVKLESTKICEMQGNGGGEEQENHEV